MKHQLTNPVSANLAVFMSLIFWSVGFPLGEVLLESWGAVSLVIYRQGLAVLLLLAIWLLVDSWTEIKSAPWKKGLGVGSIGFGLGAILLLYGQKISDAVTPAIAVAMMPIAGALIEIMMDKRIATFRFIAGALCALTGGIIATGANLADGKISLGALLCLVAVILFSWGTRGSTKGLPGISPAGQTAITMVGSLAFMCMVYFISGFFGSEENIIGSLEGKLFYYFLIFSLVSVSIAQSLWILGAARLGIFLASLHMNALPFYVMAILVVWQGQEWNSLQALGALIVAIGVVVAQSEKPAYR